MPVCLLCQSPETSLFQDASFFRCAHCYFIFKAPHLHLSAIEEKKRYDLHENNINDLAYVNFLWPVVEQVKKYKEPPAFGLDFGCGPEPVLCQLLIKENFQMRGYDPYFFPETLVEFKNNPIETFDFITCTEAAEHFYQPGKEFKKIFSWLKPGGILFLMTDFFREEIILSTWGYAKDPSHVCFFSEPSLKWLAQVHGAHLELISSRVATFIL